MPISNLGFETVVRQAFDFLQSEFGFACRRSSATAVLYVSPDAEVEVTFDIRSNEIDVEVKQHEADRSFPLHRVIQLVSVTEAERWRPVQASSPARVRKFVPPLADLLRKVWAIGSCGRSQNVRKVGGAGRIRGDANNARSPNQASS